MNSSHIAVSANTENTSIASARITGDGGLSITCYESEVPSFVEADLERLYGSVYSSLAHYRVYGGIDNASTYVARKGGEAVSVLLYRRQRQAVHVINEWIRIGDEEVNRFAAHIFERYPSVNVITFHAVEADIAKVPYPMQRYNVSDDSVLALPGTVEDYLAGLGKPTRKNIRRYMSRLTECFPSFTYTVYAGSEIDEQDVRAIIALNRVRMANKDKISGIDAVEEERMVQLAKTAGFVGVARVDGRLCGGALAFCIGRNYYSRVRAHDPAFDDYRLGLIGGFLLVSGCIARGGKELHFMWGREEHKSILRGAHRDLDRITLYRTTARMLAQPALLLQNAWAQCGVQARLRLQEAKRENSWGWRAAVQLRGMLHRFRGKAGR